MKVLLIGPLPPPIGGSSIIFRNLITKLSKDTSIKIEVISTQRKREHTQSWRWRLFHSIKFLLIALIATQRVDVVSFHSSRLAMILFGPLLYIATRLSDKPLILRLFGGSFDQEYNKLPTSIKNLLNLTIFRSEVFFMETQYLVEAFKNTTDRNNIQQLSNYTERKKTRPDTTKNCKRFIYFGRVIKEKGIDIILDAFSQTAHDITIDIYGPIEGNYTAESIDSHSNGKASYKGCLNNQQVKDILDSYDCQLLPTTWPSEGYPTAIIEGYTAGLPIITTNWRSIPEIVKPNTGIIIQEASAELLQSAISIFIENKKLFNKCQAGAYDFSSNFSEKHWTRVFLNQLRTSALNQEKRIQHHLL